MHPIAGGGMIGACQYGAAARQANVYVRARPSMSNCATGEPSPNPDRTGRQDQNRAASPGDDPAADAAPRAPGSARERRGERPAPDDAPPGVRGRTRQIREIQAELRFISDANRHAGRAGVYAGFVYVRLGNEPAPDELPYVDAFLPLAVARQYPELLVVRSIGYRDVFRGERLPARTRQVVRPGKFRSMRGKILLARLCSLPALMVLLLAALAAAIVIAVWKAG